MRFSTRRKLSRTLLAAGMIVGLSPALGACGDAAQPLGAGSLSLNWQVSPEGCADAGVQDVEVRLQNAHRTYSQSYTCTDGEAIVEGISPANYKLTVLGLDAGGHETFTSTPRTVTIGAEKLNQTDPVRLTAKPADVEVAWRFGNGKVCGANGVSTVEVALYDHADYEMARQQFSCDKGSGLVEGIIAGDYIVEAVAEGNDATYRGVSETTLKRGDHGIVDVALDQQ